jgi:hypothetical protein
MTPEALCAWQRRAGYTEKRAADALGIGASAPDGERVRRNDALLAQYDELFRPRWLDIAEIATRLARKMLTRKAGAA